MRYLSVCSGIEAATVAWHPLGWTPLAFAEVDPFPRAVLQHHYPSVPNWGDMTNFKDWPDAALDLLVGGTPCQSFSVAGLRKGLDDPRGNLMLTWLAIAGRYRPRWVVWENVPGVLSSNGGRDFGSLLGGLAELGYGFAYRILDAQYFGVAQRRRRVFVVGHLGDWRCAAAVLFERQSLSGHPAPRREAGQSVTHDVAPSLTRSGRGVEWSGDTRGQDPAVSVVGYSTTSISGGGQDSLCPPLANPLTARMGKGINTTCDEGQTLIPLGGGFDGPTHSLRAEGFDASKPGQGYPAVAQHMAVRRLTPRECERLQGFPDDYTLIPLRNAKGMPNGKWAKDGPRYKALGNSMAVLVMRWIGQRIAAVDAL